MPSTAKKQPAGGRRGRSSFGIAIAALGRGRSSFGIAIAALGRLLPPPFRRRRRIHTIELDPPLSLEGLTDLSERLVILQQSALVQFDLKLNPRQPPPPPRTRTAPVAVRDVYRRRRRPGPLTSSRTIPPLIALTLVAPAIALAASYAGLHFYESYVNEFQPPELVSINEPSNGAKILDRNGRLLYEYLHETAGQRLPVRLDQVSDAFLAATIATEDNSFFSNIGLNPRGLVRAVWENFSPLIEDKDRILKGSGGSSITQQLVKNVYIPREERLKRSLDRKAREAAYALELTQRYDKRQILEWYVNQISYGGYFNGIEAASQGYFGKPASALTLTEAALLAGMPQSPARYDPVTRPEAAIERRNSILDLIARRGAIQIGEDRFYRPSAAAIAAAKTAPLALHLKEFLIEAPHFVFNQVQPELEALFGREALYQDGLVVRTSIDLDLNYQAQSKLEHWISEFEAGSNSRNGAVIVIDAPTGEIIAYLGSRDYFREDLQGNVNNLTALNSPGSTFKPFIYLASFLKLGWDPSTIINDAPVSFVESDGTVFQPLNPVRGSYLGPIPLKTALGNSLNVPAFRTALKLGVPAIVEVAKQVGFTTLDGQYGPAIAIGGVDLSPFDLAYAYSVLANNGVMVGQRAIIPHRDDERTLDPISVLQVEDRDGNVVYDVEQRREQRRVVPAKQAYLMTSILMDGDNQCVTFGCGGVTIPGREAGVKTGTSEPFDPAGPNAGKIGETWAFGYTPDYVVGIWAGNADNDPIANIYSTTISFRAMRDTLQAIYAGAPSNAFADPEAPGELVCPPNGPACGDEVLAQRDEEPRPQEETSRTPAPSPTASPPPPTATPPQPPPPRSTVVAAAHTGASVAAIAAPTGVAATGIVAVQGSAWSDEMQFYRLEVGSGEAPSAWTSLGQWRTPVRSGTLGA